MPSNFDFAIVGAGIVGAAIAYHLGRGPRVLLLEAESAPGYHSTGRSAALFFPTYGPAMVRALTRASASFLQTPPTGFCATRLLMSRGALVVGDRAHEAHARTMLAQFELCGATPQWLEGEALRARVPVLNEDACAFGVFDPSPADVDVDALLQGFLRGARRHGTRIETDARVAHLTRTGSGWELGCADGRTFSARTIVNAAGAWVDAVAALAGLAGIGIEPRRRTAFLFDAPPGIDTHAWPAVVGVEEDWYIKPDAGMLLGSPANADLVVPHDVVPEEIDVAAAINRIEHATTLRIRRPKRTWAGLRSFVADGEPAIGADANERSFFWAAALGGYGIQSAPAVGRLCAALLCGEDVPDDLTAQGLDLALLRPHRK